MELGQLPNSARYVLVQALIGSIQNSDALRGVPIAHNPVSPAVLRDGLFFVVISEQSDDASADIRVTVERKAGVVTTQMTEKRLLSVQIVALARTEEANRDADKLHTCVMKIVRAQIQKNKKTLGVHKCAQKGLFFKQEDADVGAALVGSTLEIEYIVSEKE